jgi:four helix bundle protein|uniref:Four helix bundle protein n=1 Tax=candidate division WOR-3 bacterium TaxID=2052148 RepID=A0A7V3RHP2_UNCW3
MPKRVEKNYSISDKLKERTYRFALRILKLASMMPDTEKSKVIKRQLCKSGTSVGSNLEEADGSLTLDDFVYKVDSAFNNL